MFFPTGLEIQPHSGMQNRNQYSQESYSGFWSCSQFDCIVLLKKDPKERHLHSIFLLFDFSASLVNGYSESLLIN